MTTEKLDKLQIATVELADTIHSFFSGSQPASTLVMTRSVGDLIKGLKNYFQKKGMLAGVTLDFEDQATEAYRYLANFSKHADRDPDKTASYADFEGYLALQSVIFDYKLLLSAMWKEEMLDLDAIAADEVDPEKPYYNRTLLICQVFEDWADAFNETINSPQFEALLTQFKNAREYLMPAEARLEGSETITEAGDNVADLRAEFIERTRERGNALFAQLESILLDEEKKRERAQALRDLGYFPVRRDGGIAIATKYRDKFTEHIIHRSYDSESAPTQKEP